jgi:hypothetical protein
MKVTFAKPYTMKVRSYRGWMIAIQGIWVLYVNAVILAYNILAAIFFALWYILVTIPVRLITGRQDAIRANRLDRAKGRMQDYMDGR